MFLFLVSLSLASGHVALKVERLNCYGAKLGMKRAEVENLELPQTIVEYSEVKNTVVSIRSGRLFHDAELLLDANSQADDVRKIFGEPESSVRHHVAPSVGGVTWNYPRYGLQFIFLDDFGFKGLEAPLYEVVLFRPGGRR